jgi:hypothetical protein
MLEKDRLKLNFIKKKSKLTLQCEVDDDDRFCECFKAGPKELANACGFRNSPKC